MIAEIIKNIQGRGPSRPEARIVLDSVSPSGDRLTTMEVRMHRFVLAEFNTHRVFSRNSASSRAIPTYTRVRSVLTDLAWPIEWGTLKSGMQAGPEAVGLRRQAARAVWFLCALVAVAGALTLRGLRIHKQITNRLLEPFLWHTVVVSSTEWANFFTQRSRYYTRLAQPEIAAAADAMHDAYVASEPQKLDYGEWHLPFIDDDTMLWAESADEALEDPVLTQIQLSVARAARSSYDKHNEIGPQTEDLARYAKLVNATPPHWSPLEHAATPAHPLEQAPGNFKGWWQWRHYDQRDPMHVEALGEEQLKLQDSLRQEQPTAKPLNCEFDARVWAAEFVRVARRNQMVAMDEEAMTSWFANAIMAGHDYAIRDTVRRLQARDAVKDAHRLETGTL